MEVGLWGNARQWSYRTFSTATEPVDVHERRPSTAQWQTSVDESHGVGMGREDRLYYCLAAVEWSLRAADVRPLDEDVRAYLRRVALYNGRIGWEAATRALHKLHKRAWDYNDARHGRLVNSSGYLERCLSDSWPYVRQALQEQEQIANTKNINNLKHCVNRWFSLIIFRYNQSKIQQ